MCIDAGLTAKNLGHPNTTLLRKDYNGAATKAQAEAFFAILPKDCRYRPFSLKTMAHTRGE